jgi:hypothetical protein
MPNELEVIELAEEDVEALADDRVVVDDEAARTSPRTCRHVFERSYFPSGPSTIMPPRI